MYVKHILCSLRFYVNKSVTCLKYSSLNAITNRTWQGLVPARVTDGMLRLTCQRENSLSFDDWWQLISNHNQGFIRSTWQDRYAMLAAVTLCYPDSLVTLMKCYRKLLFWKMIVCVGRVWRARTDVTCHNISTPCIQGQIFHVPVGGDF